MLTDAHCHPFDLARVFPGGLQEHKNLTAAASACSIEDLSFNEELSRNSIKEGLPLVQCFGIHPQIFKLRNEESAAKGGASGEERLPSPEEEGEILLEALELSAREGRISALGECGFDLYDSGFKESEKLQETFFSAQLEIALKYEMPLVLHVRRAMHKIFALAKTLSKCRSAVFHSWPGTYEEALSLLKRGVNAYFSFGNTIMLNHKQALRSCALLPVQRLLTETDAPYQPRRAEKFSRWSDLPLILNAASSLRGDAGEKITVKDLEAQIEGNFHRAFAGSFAAGAR